MRLRNDRVHLESMQQTRRAPDPTRRITAVEFRRIQRFARRQMVCEVKWRVASRHAHAVLPVLLDVDSPGTAPSQRTKPNLSRFLIGLLAVLNRKPWIDLIPGRTAPALQNHFARMHRLLLQIPLPRPAPRQIPQLIIGARGQIPRPSESFLHRQWRARVILNPRRSRHNSRYAIDSV